MGGAGSASPLPAEVPAPAEPRLASPPPAGLGLPSAGRGRRRAQLRRGSRERAGGARRRRRPPAPTLPALRSPLRAESPAEEGRAAAGAGGTEKGRRDHPLPPQFYAVLSYLVKIGLSARGCSQDVGAGTAGRRRAVRTLQNSQGEGLILRDRESEPGTQDLWKNPWADLLYHPVPIHHPYKEGNGSAQRQVLLQKGSSEAGTGLEGQEWKSSVQPVAKSSSQSKSNVVMGNTPSQRNREKGSFTLCCATSGRVSQTLLLLLLTGFSPDGHHLPHNLVPKIGPSVATGALSALEWKDYLIILQIALFTQPGACFFRGLVLFGKSMKLLVLV